MKRYEAEMRHEIGIDKLMWGADYPHLEGAAPVHRETLRYIFGGMPEDDVRRMLGANAVELWGFDGRCLAGGGRPGGPDGRRPGVTAGAVRHRGHVQLEPGPACAVAGRCRCRCRWPVALGAGGGGGGVVQGGAGGGLIG